MSLGTSQCNINPIGPAIGYDCNHPINIAGHIIGAIPTFLSPIAGIIRIATAFWKLCAHKEHNGVCNQGNYILEKHIGRGVAELFFFGWILGICDIIKIIMKGCNLGYSSVS